jgi:hypothetical protein
MSPPPTNQKEKPALNYDIDGSHSSILESSKLAERKQEEKVVTYQHPA